MHPSGSVDLSEMFGELKQELEEEVAAGDDDPETHYNLGVAFREMGLLDEAIAEFQKVCTAIDRGKAFSQPVQTYTWLAQCFLDKGVPEAAIRWYEKALNIPGLDDEARVAINYELGSACESAQDKPAALRHFTRRVRREYRLSRRGRAHSGPEVVECTKWVRNLRWGYDSDPAPSPTALLTTTRAMISDPKLPFASEPTSVGELQSPAETFGTRLVACRQTSSIRFPAARSFRSRVCGSAASECFCSCSCARRSG